MRIQEQLPKVSQFRLDGTMHYLSRRLILASVQLVGCTEWRIMDAESGVRLSEVRRPDSREAAIFAYFEACRVVELSFPSVARPAVFIAQSGDEKTAQQRIALYYQGRQELHKELLAWWQWRRRGM